MSKARRFVATPTFSYNTVIFTKKKYHPKTSLIVFLHNSMHNCSYTKGKFKNLTMIRGQRTKSREVREQLKQGKSPISVNILVDI